MITFRSVTAFQPSTTSTGTSQTQWWTHETGDTSSPHNAVVVKAKVTLALRTTYAVNARTTRATRIQYGSWPSRANAPRSDWLPTCTGDPMRSPLKISFVQYSTDGPGRSTNASALAARNVTPVRTADL